MDGTAGRGHHHPGLTHGDDDHHITCGNLNRDHRRHRCHRQTLHATSTEERHPIGLQVRLHTTTEPDKDQTGDVAHYAGNSEWEKHSKGDELVMVVEGSPDIGGSRASMALMAAETLLNAGHAVGYVHTRDDLRHDQPTHLVIIKTKTLTRRSPNK